MIIAGGKQIGNKMYRTLFNLSLVKLLVSQYNYTHPFWYQTEVVKMVLTHTDSVIMHTLKKEGWNSGEKKFFLRLTSSSLGEKLLLDSG